MLLHIERIKSLNSSLASQPGKLEAQRHAAKARELKQELIARSNEDYW